MIRWLAVVVVALGLGFAVGVRVNRPSPPSPNTSPGDAHTGHAMQAETSGTPGERRVLYWVDPMNPGNRSDRPGKAPDGMDLVPVYADEQTEGPPGTVRLSAEKRQMIGVKVGPVVRERATRVIRTVARVDYDERLVREVRTRISGWVNKLFVDFTGKLVAAGEPLFDVYSPELVATQTEYLLALEGHERLRDNAFPQVAAGSGALLDVTRKRLLLWNVTEQELREIERTRRPKTFLTLYSPIQGFVLQKDVFEGKYVTPDMAPFRIADLSTVWVTADVYEYELPYVQVGQPATVTLSALPGRRFDGRLTYVYPDVNPDTRTARARFEFPNSGWSLKPGMYANVELQVDLGEQLLVPREAVLDSGERRIVFVAHDDGRFEPRDVEVGPTADAGVIIVSGLTPGEAVVVSGNYLIDSESRLKSALGAMGHAHGGS